MLRKLYIEKFPSILLFDLFANFLFQIFARELKKAQLARAAAEEKVLSTDRILTRSTVQSNPRTSRLIGKKMNRSVSLTIY